MTTHVSKRRSWWGLDSPTGFVVGVTVVFSVLSLFVLFVMPAIGSQGNMTPLRNDSDAYPTILLDKTALAPNPGSWND